MFDNEWLSLLWMLVCILVVLGLAYWFTRHVLGRGLLRTYGAQGGPGGKLQALARLSLGRDQQLLLVRVGERVLLLGVSGSGGIRTLAELTPEEAEPWLKAGEEGQSQQPPSFQEALRKVIDQRRKKG